MSGNRHMYLDSFFLINNILVLQFVIMHNYNHIYIIHNYYVSFVDKIIDKRNIYNFFNIRRKR